MIDATCELRGLTVGVSPYIWESEPVGLLSTPPIRVDDRDRPNRDGVIPGGDFLAGRQLQFGVTVLGSSPGEVEALAAALAAAWAPSRGDVELRVRVTGEPAEYLLVGRARGAEVSLGRPNELFGGFVAYALLRFTATDPVRYSAVEESVTLSLTAPGVGLTYPVTYPVVYGGGGGSGSGVALNAGSAAVDWTAVLTGPLVAPRIRLSDGLSNPFVLVASSIAAGQTVTLDSRRGSIKLAGTAPRPAWFGAGSSWFKLPPGSSGLLLTADAGSGTAVVSWRSGWS